MGANASTEWRLPTVAAAISESIGAKTRHPARDFVLTAALVGALGVLLPDPSELSLAGIAGVLIGGTVGAVQEQRRFGRPARYQVAAALANILFIGALFTGWVLVARVVANPPGASPAERLAEALGLPSITFAAVTVIGLLWFFVWQQMKSDGRRAERAARIAAERRARAADALDRRR